MSWLRILAGILLPFLYFFGVNCNSPGDEQRPKPSMEMNKKVLIIGIDGCRPDGIKASVTPNIDELVANSTYSFEAQCLFTTSSGPGWTSMLSGVWEDKHNVTDNSYNGSNLAGYPHFFKRVEGANPNHRTVSIVEWNPINDYMASLHADVVINANSDNDVKNAVANELTNNDPTVLFAQLSNVDYAGHGTGFTPNNPNYIKAIEEVDAQIGTMISALKNRSTYSQENWLILLSTDHGGLGTSHGGPSDEERTIFVVASGETIPNKEILAETKEVTIPPAYNCLESDVELWLEDAFIQVPHHSNLNFGDSQDFSVECRIRGTIPGDVGIVGKKDWATGLNPGYVFSFKPNTRKFKVNIGDGSNRVDVETEEITDNNWHMVSATFDRDGLLKVFIDGILKASVSLASIGNINTNLPFTIGADGKLNWRYQGYIAEVRLFNGLLEDTDIDDWKCKILDNTHPKYNNILGHWKLDDAGNDILDSSGNGYHGTLTNGIWKDAKSSTIEIVKNFESTPRTVDVAVTALNHLCIDLEPEWDLDGRSLIERNCEK